MAQSRGVIWCLVGGEGYAEEDDALMMDYMENEGVGNEEMWTTVDLRDETLGRPMREGTYRERRTGATDGADVHRGGQGSKARKRERHHRYASMRGS